MTRFMYPTLSFQILGGIQPDLLRDLWDPKGRADGFVDRFLFAFPAPIRRVYRTQGIGASTLDAYWSLIYKLQDRATEPTARTLIGFLPEARALWDTFSSDHFARVEQATAYLRGSLSKLHSYAARFALALQVGYKVAGETVVEDVEARTVENAIRLTRYFAAHARKAHRHVRGGHEATQLSALLHWIAGRSDGTATVREVVTSKVAGFRTAGDTMSAFERLVSMGAGKVVTSSHKGGKPSVAFQCSRNNR